MNAQLIVTITNFLATLTPDEFFALKANVDADNFTGPLAALAANKAELKATCGFFSKLNALVQAIASYV